VSTTYVYISRQIIVDAAKISDEKVTTFHLSYQPSTIHLEEGHGFIGVEEALHAAAEAIYLVTMTITIFGILIGSKMSGKGLVESMIGGGL
jgi:cytochrome b